MGRAAVMGVGALVCASVGVGSPHSVAAQTVGITRAVLDSDADSYVVVEGHATYADLQPLNENGSEVSLRLGPDFSEYRVTFAAPLGEQLGVGTFEGAVDPGERSEGHPGLDVSGHGRACTHVSGRFVVDELTRDGSGTITSFAARFEQHCENFTPGVFGTVQYHATTVYPERTITPNVLGFRALPDDVAPPQVVTIANVGPTSITPSAPVLDGPDAAEFRIASSSCGQPLGPGQQCTIGVAFAPTGEPGHEVQPCDSPTSSLSQAEEGVASSSTARP